MNFRFLKLISFLLFISSLIGCGRKPISAHKPEIKKLNIPDFEPIFYIDRWSHYNIDIYFLINFQV